MTKLLHLYLGNKDQAKSDSSECDNSHSEYSSADVYVCPQAKGDQCQDYQYDARNVDYRGNEFGVPQAWELHLSGLKGQHNAYYLQHEEIGVNEYLEEVCWGRCLVANPDDILFSNPSFLCRKK